MAQAKVKSGDGSKDAGTTMKEKQSVMDQALNKAAEDAQDQRRGEGDRVEDQGDVTNRDGSEKRSGRSKH